MYSIHSIIKEMKDVLKRHEVAPGQYCRWLWDGEQEKRALGSNAYGCADAANIRYTLNIFPFDPEERAACIQGIQSFQDKETGIFKDATHSPIHTTAHCTAALELFDARPLYPFTSWEAFKEPENLQDYLEENLNGHTGAGVFSAMAITGDADEAWKRAYFDWFNSRCHADTGLWTRGRAFLDAPSYFNIGDAFHYLFNYEYAREPIPYPDKLIDSCLEAYYTHSMDETFGKQFHFLEMDWVFCLNRASRQTPHRFAEIKQTLKEFAGDFIVYLNGVDWEHDDGANDLHLLFGVLCCLAELQQALPGEIISEKPLRLVLDRRPFI